MTLRKGMAQGQTIKLRPWNAWLIFKKRKKETESTEEIKQWCRFCGYYYPGNQFFLLRCRDVESRFKSHYSANEILENTGIQKNPTTEYSCKSFFCDCS